MCTIIQDDNFFQTFLFLISSATHEIIIVNFLVSTSFKFRQPIIFNLQDAFLRGVNIFVCLNGNFRGNSNGDINRKFLDEIKSYCKKSLLTRNIATEHRKLLIVDRKILLIGSHNLTRNSLKSNKEISLLIRDPDLCNDIYSLLSSDYPSLIPPLSIN